MRGPGSHNLQEPNFWDRTFGACVSAEAITWFVCDNEEYHGERAELATICAFLMRARGVRARARIGTGTEAPRTSREDGTVAQLKFLLLATSFGDGCAAASAAVALRKLEDGRRRAASEATEATRAPREKKTAARS